MHGYEKIKVSDLKFLNKQFCKVVNILTTKAVFQNFNNIHNYKNDTNVNVETQHFH